MEDTRLQRLEEESQDSRKEIADLHNRVSLPADSLIHPVFHISLLRRYYGSPPSQLSPLPEWPCAQIPQPASVLDARCVNDGDHRVEQVLVQWLGHAKEDSTWVNLEELVRYFPTLGLGVKARFLDGGDDTTAKHEIDDATARQKSNDTREEVSEPNELSQTSLGQQEQPNRRSSRDRRPPKWAKDFHMEGLQQC